MRHVSVQDSMDIPIDDSPQAKGEGGSGEDGCCDIIARMLRLVSIITALALAGCQIFSIAIDVNPNQQSTSTVHWITTLLLRIAGIGLCALCSFADCDCIRERRWVPQALVGIVNILEYWSVRGLFYFFIGLFVLEMSYECHSHENEGLTGVAMDNTLLWVMWVTALVMCVVGALYFLFSLLCINRFLKSKGAGPVPSANSYNAIP